MARGPSFDPRPFAGTNAPPGASPEALRELEKMKQADEGREAPPAPTRKRGRRPPPAAAPPRQEPEQADEDEDGEAPQRADTKPRSRTRRAASRSGHGRPAKEDRVQRAVRLTAPLDAKLRELAEFRGVDLNAAMSVAIVEDWRRCFGSHVDRS